MFLIITGSYQQGKMSFFETIEQNRQNFILYNNAKFERFQQLFANNNVKKVINSIPFFLSVNNQKIPGYVEGEVPFGIVGYQPDEDTKKFVQVKFRAQNLHFIESAHFVQMLAVMGSVGTIAYTKRSDFDYWVCVDKKSVSEEMNAAFQKKIDAIQKWVMNEIKLEVHLFVNDIDSIKENIFAEDEDEAFGSTMGAVLKDEFYRSSIVITGKTPFWWVVPRFVADREYSELYENLTEEMKMSQFVDLGNLYEIPKEDFLGPALFQLVKALGNPFKSILKIGVLEKYLFSSERFPLLSQKVKSNILRGNLDISILDSYILMFEEVCDYYSTIIDDEGLLNMLRQNLYLKIDPSLSKYTGIQNTKNFPYNVSVMIKYISEWGWNAKNIKDLDDFNNWDYKKIMNYWNMIKKFMLLSYQRISTEMPSLNLASRISDSDFKLLSRKIKTNFTFEEDKIDQYITFKDTPYEPILYIGPANEGIDNTEWMLAKRNASTKDRFVSTVLKIESDLVKLLAWTGINQIFDPTFSRVKIQSGYSRVNQNLVTDLMTEIYNLFIAKKVKLKNEYFLKAAFNLKNMIIINFNMENVDSVKIIYHLYKTSWGESYLKKYRTEVDLINILEKILSDGIFRNSEFDEYCSIVTPGPFKKEYKAFERLFRDAYAFIVSIKSNISRRMIAILGNQYIVMSRNGKRITVDSYPNFIKLLSENTFRPGRDMLYSFYGEELSISTMDMIYDLRKDNAVSIVYEEKGDLLLVHVLNERGNIFTFIKHIRLKEACLIYMFDFCKNVISQINNTHVLPDLDSVISVNRLAVDRFDKRQFINESSAIEEMHLLKCRSENAFRATIRQNEKKIKLYSVMIPGVGSTDFVPFNRLANSLGQSGDKKMAAVRFVSSIKFQDSKEEELRLGSTLYFLEKNRLEIIIDRSVLKK